MVYKKKAAVLSALVVVLALVYFLSFVLDPQRPSKDSFAWLNPASLTLVDAIEIDGSGGKTVLNRKNNIWVFPSAGNIDYPVKQGRVDDFLAQLTRRDVYPLRSASSEGAEKLGFAGGNAARITLKGGAGLPLLDLLIGSGAAVGNEVYLKRSDKNEIYSGEDHFTLYTDGKPSDWYDLRLFPVGPSSGIDVKTVQQAEIVLPANEGSDATQAPSYTLSRRGDGWVITGNESVSLDTPKVEAWLRSVLEAEGGDFATAAPASVEGSISLRLGDGTIRTIQAGPPGDDKSRLASVSGSGLTYALTEWTLNRIFRASDYFVKAAQ